MNKQVADSLDLYCREFFGFEEICLLATLIIFVSQAIGGYCRYCHNAGSYPTIFMIIVRWSVLPWISFLWKIQFTSRANILWKCFLRAPTFHLFSWLDFSFLHLGDQAVLRWLRWNYCEYHLAVRVWLSVQWPLIWLVSNRTLQRWLIPLSVFEFVRAFYPKSTLCATS